MRFLRKVPRFINDLIIFLHAHQAQLARVVIACRRAMWNSAWMADVPLPLVAYHVDHLDEEDYGQILHEPRFVRHSLRSVKRSGIAPRS